MEPGDKEPEGMVGAMDPGDQNKPEGYQEKAKDQVEEAREENYKPGIVVLGLAMADKETELAVADSDKDIQVGNMAET